MIRLPPRACACKHRSTYHRNIGRLVVYTKTNIHIHTPGMYVTGQTAIFII